MPVKKTTEKYISELPDSIKLKSGIKYISAHKKLPHICQICGDEWTTTPTIILYGKGHGCPRCNGKHKKSTSEFVDLINKIGKVSLDKGQKFKNNDTKLKFSCNVCKDLFESLPGNILKGHGCPKCGILMSSKLRTKTTSEHIKTLPDNIRLNDNEVYISAHTKIKYKCVKCDYIWLARPDKINKESQCPSCRISSSGFRCNKPAILYLVQFDNIFKVGITNRTIQKRLSGFPNYVILKEIKYLRGDDAREMERNILHIVKKDLINTNVLPNGNTETFNKINAKLHKLLGEL